MKRTEKLWGVDPMKVIFVWNMLLDYIKIAKHYTYSSRMDYITIAEHYMFSNRMDCNMIAEHYMFSSRMGYLLWYFHFVLSMLCNNDLFFKLTIPYKYVWQHQQFLVVKITLPLIQQISFCFKNVSSHEMFHRWMWINDLWDPKVFIFYIAKSHLFMIVIAITAW